MESHTEHNMPSYDECRNMAYKMVEHVKSDSTTMSLFGAATLIMSACICQSEKWEHNLSVAIDLLTAEVQANRGPSWTNTPSDTLQ